MVKRALRGYGAMEHNVTLFWMAVLLKEFTILEEFRNQKRLAIYK